MIATQRSVPLACTFLFGWTLGIVADDVHDSLSAEGEPYDRVSERSRLRSAPYS